MKGGVTTKNRCDKESEEIGAALTLDWMRGWDAISRLNLSVGCDKGEQSKEVLEMMTMIIGVEKIAKDCKQSLKSNL